MGTRINEFYRYVKKMLMKSLLPLTILFLLTAGCYTFSGITIEENIQKYYVAQFVNRSASVVPTLAPDFTEKLKDKIRNESRLIYTDTDPDVEFVGTITGYDVTSEAPQPGETVAINRLTIRASVEVSYPKDPNKETEKLNVSWYAEFPGTDNLLDVQDDLISEITDQLAEDIFTKAFTNW